MNLLWNSILTLHVPLKACTCSDLSHQHFQAAFETLYFKWFFFTTVFFQWNFSHGKFGFPSPGESQLRQCCATQPRVHTWCFSVSVIHRPNSDMDYGNFNVPSDENACDCARGCTDTVRESALKVDWGGGDPQPHRGNEPPSAACRSDALTNWATSPPHTSDFGLIFNNGPISSFKAGKWYRQSMSDIVEAGEWSSVLVGDSSLLPLYVIYHEFTLATHTY